MTTVYINGEPRQGRRPMKVGQRVMTKPFGPGEVLGFECFSGDGRRSLVDDHDNGESRVLVKLDRPERWLLTSEKQPHPFMMRSDFEEDF